STALMGALLAASTLPRVLAAPFAGVLVDRTDRKRLLIAMDLVRGAAVVLVALAGLAGFLRIWMVFAAGVTIGIGGAFFSPAVVSILPEIVPRDKLVQANASYSLISTGSSVLGNSAGGFLFQLLGAPLLFLFNGVSYLVSSATLLIVRVPKHPPASGERHFFAELGEGLKLVTRMRGLRNLFVTAGLLNFFGVMGLTLILPFFQRTPGLGPARYGLAMAGMTGGMVLGFLLSSAVKIPPTRRLRVFAVSAYIQALGMIVFPQTAGLGAMIPILIVSGTANAVLNSFLIAIIQMTVPRTMLGKVSSLLMTLSGGLIPLSMAVGGVLAEYIPLRALISGCFVVMILCATPLMFSRAFHRFINFDPAKEAPESLLD
ncbi:MAG: MFS transporter, partial [Candidatus Aminicenantales bacterium]